MAHLTQCSARPITGESVGAYPGHPAQAASPGPIHSLFLTGLPLTPAPLKEIALLLFPILEIYLYCPHYITMWEECQIKMN